LDYVVFCTAFILQFVGHRIGDFFLQTYWQAMYKSTNRWARSKHCFVYSLTISALLLFAFDWKVCLAVFALTFAEHYWIDSGKPVAWWLTFQERVLARNAQYELKQTPAFVVIEYDQTVHYVRIFLLSLLIGYGIVS